MPTVSPKKLEIRKTRKIKTTKEILHKKHTCVKIIFNAMTKN
jgi:hypothetical protein